MATIYNSSMSKENIGIGFIITTLQKLLTSSKYAFLKSLERRLNQIDRLNIGPVPTTKVQWNQPHEGNLFEHLYRQRALQVVG